MVLADYGKDSSLYFQYLNDSSKNFSLKNIVPLEIVYMEISLDGKYLAVACGSPSLRLFIVDIESHSVIGGARGGLDLSGKAEALKKIDFNPNNRKMFSLLYEKYIEIYEIKSCFQVSEDNQEIEESVLMKLRKTL